MRKRQNLHWNESLSPWLWELKVCPGAGKEIEPSLLEPGGPLSTPGWKIWGWDTLPLLHYFIRLLTNKHMETIHSREVITFSFKGMAGPVSSVKNYLNPSLTSNPPSHFPKFCSHAFQRVWWLFCSFYRTLCSVHPAPLFHPGVTQGRGDSRADLRYHHPHDGSPPHPSHGDPLSNPTARSHCCRGRVRSLCSVIWANPEPSQSDFKHSVYQYFSITPFPNTLQAIQWVPVYAFSFPDWGSSSLSGV